MQRFNLKRKMIYRFKAKMLHNVAFSIENATLPFVLTSNYSPCFWQKPSPPIKKQIDITKIKYTNNIKSPKNSKYQYLAVANRTSP